MGGSSNLGGAKGEANRNQRNHPRRLTITNTLNVVEIQDVGGW
jgi:hypothetical protein